MDLFQGIRIELTDHLFSRYCNVHESNIRIPSRPVEQLGFDRRLVCFQELCRIAADAIFKFLESDLDLHFEGDAPENVGVYDLRIVRVGHFDNQRVNFLSFAAVVFVRTRVDLQYCLHEDLQGMLSRAQGMYNPNLVKHRPDQRWMKRLPGWSVAADERCCDSLHTSRLPVFINLSNVPKLTDPGVWGLGFGVWGLGFG